MMENATYEQRVAALNLPVCPWMAEREAEFDFLRKRSPGRAEWRLRHHRAPGGLLADRSPRLAGQLWSAAFTFPAALAVGTRGDNYWLYDLSLWVMAAIFSGLIGLVLGNALDPDGRLSEAKS